MGDHENDYDRIAKAISEALAVFIGSAHEPRESLGNSITITKDGFITGIIKFQSLCDWAKGLAATHHSYD